MKVTVLGCGGSAGVPTIGGAGDWGTCDPAEPRNRRTRSSIIIEGPAGRILVDTGPDLRGQLLACAVPRVDAIFYTHAHADHVMGLDEVRILNRIAGKPIPAFATQATRQELERRFDYAFRPWVPPGFHRPVLEMATVCSGEVVRTCGLDVRLFAQDHHVTQTLGLKAGGFAYSTDVVRLDEAALAALEGVDTWLVACFQRAPHLTHAGLDQILAWQSRLGVRRMILTHMGFDMDWAWMIKHLPPGIEPAHDGMLIEVAE